MFISLSDLWCGVGKGDSLNDVSIRVWFTVGRETNSMVEEFMLLANVTVAKKIQEEFPHCACLRRHPAPPPSNFDPLIKAAKSKVSGS